MSSLPEALLARLTTPDRAAAIYGDLAELATTKGRLWFWTTYLRALISLGWRTPVAFVVGFAFAVNFKYAALLFRHNMVRFQTWINFTGIQGQHIVPHQYMFLWTHPYIQQLISYTSIQLWFVVPFAAILYGLRDRMVRLGIAFLLMTIGMMLSVPVLSPFLAFASFAVIAASVISANWRRPAIALFATTVISGLTLLSLGVLAHTLCWIVEHKPLNASSHYRFFDTGYAFPHTLFWIVTWTIGVLYTLSAAITCSRLHKRTLTKQLEIA